MKTLKFFVVVFISILFISASFAQTLLKEQTVSTNFGKNLKVSVPAGDVKITTWNKEEVYVKITGNDEAKEKYDFTINSNSGDVEVKAETKNKENSKNVSLIVDVSVPDKFNTSVSTAGGDIKIENSLTGNIKFNTAGGDISVSSVAGVCELNTAGGDITVLNFSGDLNVNTAGGDLNLKGSDGEVKANTTGGEVKLAYSGENKGVKINTLGGNIDLTLPSGFKADCKLSTMNGDIKSDINIESKKPKKEVEGMHSIKGLMNGGGNALECSTMGGNITIHSL